PRLLRTVQLPHGPLDAPRLPEAHRCGTAAAEKEALAAGRVAAAIVPGPGPWCQQEQEAGAVLGRHCASLVGRKRDERPGAGVDHSALALDPHLPLDDEHQRVLLDLVLAELLARLEPDEHCAPLVL